MLEVFVMELLFLLGEFVDLIFGVLEAFVAVGYHVFFVLDLFDFGVELVLEVLEFVLVIFDLMFEHISNLTIILTHSLLQLTIPLL